MPLWLREPLGELEIGGALALIIDIERGLLTVVFSIGPYLLKNGSTDIPLRGALRLALLAEYIFELFVLEGIGTDRLK